MPAIQTTYNSTHPAAYEGMVADIVPATIISRTVENAALGFGKVAVQGAGAQATRAPTTGVTNFIGITVRDQAADPNLASQYAIGATAALLTYGAIWVLAGETVAEGDPVYFVPLTGALMLLQGIVEFMRCIIAVRDGAWPQRLHDVQELDQQMLQKAEQGEYQTIKDLEELGQRKGAV